MKKFWQLFKRSLPEWLVRRRQRRPDAEPDGRREAALSLKRDADALAHQRRFAEAEARYIEAFNAAQALDDPGLQGIILQSQAVLMRRQKNLVQAADLFRYAVSLLGKAGAIEDEMYTCDMLATAQLQLDELDSAEIWYGRSLELAERQGNRRQVAVVAQNRGILLQKRADHATDLEDRRRLLEQAIDSVNQSLTIKRELDHREGIEASCFQLSVLHWKSGDLDRAQDYLLQATELCEKLKLSKVYKNYRVLARLAREQGDETAAHRWQAKCNAKVAELQRRHRNEKRPDKPGVG